MAGLRLDEGLLTPYFINNRDNLRADLDNVSVLITKKPLDSVQELVPILEDLMRKGEPRLAIFCEEITDEVLGFLVTNKLQGNFNPVVVKTRDMDDLEIIIGAQVVTLENNLKISNETMGRAKRIEAAKYHTTIIGLDDKDTKQAITKTINETRAQIKSAETSIEKDMFRKRIARLQGGVAVVKVAGENDQQTKEKKLKMEDALNATKAAIEDGIVEGGGMALLRIANDIKLRGAFSKTEAYEIMTEVMRAPARQIIKNADEDEELFKRKVDELGYNVLTRKWENLYELGIIDPVKVVKCALKNAIHMGTQILTAEAAIIYGEEKKKKT